MPSLVVFEKNPTIRRGLLVLLADLRELVLLDVAPSGESLLQICQMERPDVAVVYRLARGQDAFQLGAELRTACPATQLIVITFSLARTHVEWCLDARVRGIVASEDISGELVPAVRTVLVGGRYLSRKVLTTLPGLASSKLH